MKDTSSSSAREIVGLVIAGLGVALVPVGWYASRLLWVASVVLVLIGFVMLRTDRVSAAEREMEDQATPNPPPVRQSVPGDINNYSGWRDGGQSLGGGGDAD